MHLDRLIILYLLASLSLLCLPDFLLLKWQSAVVICLFLLPFLLIFDSNFNLRRGILYLLFVLVSLAYVHHSAIQLRQKAEQVATLPNKVKTELTIVEILHQQQYQTAIAEGQLTPEGTSQRIYVQWQLAEPVKIGERWNATLQLRPLSSRLNFNGFDRQKWYFAQGITAWAKVKSAVKIGEDLSWRTQWLNQQYQRTQGLSHQGLLLALGFGERAWLDKQHWQIYQQTNTAHLIAISGLHIGLAMALGFLLARALQFFLPTRWISPYFPICSGLILAIFYANLAGFAIPTLRAVVALLIFYTLRMVRQHWTPWQLLLRVLAILLLFDPLMLLSSSFWLSFGAVVCLILWYQLFPLSLLHWRGKAWQQSRWGKVRWFFSLFHLQIGLLWFFTPIQIALFGYFSLNSLIANLLAVPFFSVLLVPCVLFAVITQGAFASWQWVDYLAQFITDLLRFFTQNVLTFSIAQSQWLSVVLILLSLLAIYWLYEKSPQNPPHFSAVPTWQRRPKGFHLVVQLPLTKRFKGTVYLASLTYCVGQLAVWLVDQRDDTTWQVETLDVGQGLATLIVKNQRAILYDTGSAWQGGSMAALEILPYLQREGIQLDKLILSHDDNDHAGGAKEILSHYPDVEFITPSDKNYGEIHRTFCVAGQQWQWQGLQIEAFSPSHTVQRANNTDSCVLRISDHQHHLLLTGDADYASERQWTKQVGKIDVLQVGHHGSNTSTSADLLAHIEPKIALISSGRWNPWGFPHSPVLARLQQAKVDTYNTGQTGQIRVRFSTNGINVETAREDFSPWYRQFIGLRTK